MIQELDTTGFFKGIKSEPAANTPEDMQILQDMLETRYYNEQKNNKCYYMTANMIGVNKRIMIIPMDWTYEVIINPVELDITEFLTPEEIENDKKSLFYPDMSAIALEYYNEKWEKKRTLFRNDYGDIKKLLDRLDGIF